MVTKEQITKAKHVLRFRLTIKVRVFQELMGGIIWQDACKILHEVGWFKFNAYQWAHPSMKKLVE